MSITKLGNKIYSSSFELEIQKELLDLMKNSPIPDDEKLQNIGLYINSKLLSRILFFHHIYLIQLPVHGLIMEFGTRWGQNISIFSALRGIYEPFNRQRKIIGFDTFKGFLSPHNMDGPDRVANKSGYNVTINYEKYLHDIMACQEKFNPLSHIKRYEIIKGDAAITLKRYLKEHPETMISLVYFDMDLYEPTIKCLKLLKPYLNKGCVIGFDELCDDVFPGETIAFRKIFKQKYKIIRLPITSRTSYIIFDK